MESMLYSVFSQILNMSITSGIVICVVLGIRILLKKAPKIFSYLLWSVVLFRMLCPLAVTSSFSALKPLDVSVDEAGRMEFIRPQLPENETVPNAVFKQPDKGGETVSVQEESAIRAVPAQKTDARKSAVRFASIVWFSGVLAMTVYAVGSYIIFRRKLKGAFRKIDNIYISDAIDTPFALGVVSPGIYLPAFLTEKEASYVIMHEQTHIRRGDTVFKIFAFAALTLHWLNPLAWAAFYAAEKDMEMSCDEAVMKKMKDDIRADYSKTLLSLAAGKRIAAGVPLAFGEGDTKSRVKNIMRYKKPAAAVVFAAALAVLGCVIIFGTNPVQKNESDDSVFASGTEAFLQDDDAVKEYADRWAKAFCGRDGAVIAAMSSEETKEKLKADQLLDEAGGSWTFGMSSPWPMNDDFAYLIISAGDEQAEILYYAQTSEPHVCVWKETLKFARDSGGAYIVKEEDLKIFDEISSGEEFQSAYPYGILDTPLDYLKNDTAEILNQNALLSSTWLYSILSDPESAAVYLLNLSADAVETSAKETDREGTVQVSLQFADGFDTTVCMVRFSKNLSSEEFGIWVFGDDYEEEEVSQDSPEGLMYSENMFLGQYTENGNDYFADSYGEDGVRILYSAKADITHDGIADRIDLVLGTKDMDTPAEDLLEGITCGYLKIYKGLEKDVYEQEACFISERFSHSHAANGQISLVKKDGQDYLLLSNMYSMGGNSEYSYAVFYIDTDLKTAVCEEEDMIEFVSDPGETGGRTEPKPEDVLPDFRQNLSKWLEDGVLLVSCDLDDSPNICISKEGAEYQAMDYYNRVWER